MLFKKISYLGFWQSSCLVEHNHLCNFERRHYGEHSCEVIWNLKPMVQNEMSSKEISYIELCQSLCSADQNHLCNFG